PHLRYLVGEVVPAAGEEVGEHDFGDRPDAGHRRAHRGADDRLFGDGRVPDPPRAELLEQPDGRLEHALRGADVLAETHDRRVAAHLPGDPLGDRFAIRAGAAGCGPVRHCAPPSAQTSVSASAGSAGGAALAADTAAATSSATPP